jgi:hypothetical protein
MVARLRKVDVRKTEFLAVLGHELRNPLGTLRTSLDLLKSGTLDEAQTRYTHTIMERQVGQMRHLIEDLLDIARIDQGKIVLRTGSVPVAAAVADAVAASRTYTEPMRQSVVVDVPAGVDTIEADSARVTQVLTNLLHNASKFSPRGSRIEVTAQPVDTGVAITVRDSGSAFPARNSTPSSGRSSSWSQAPAARQGWDWACHSCASSWKCTAARCRRAAKVPARGRSSRSCSRTGGLTLSHHRRHRPRRPACQRIPCA